jgi:hypothetical protein
VVSDTVEYGFSCYTWCKETCLFFKWRLLLFSFIFLNLNYMIWYESFDFYWRSNVTLLDITVFFIDKYYNKLT